MSVTSLHISDDSSTVYCTDTDGVLFVFDFSAAVASYTERTLHKLQIEGSDLQEKREVYGPVFRAKLTEEAVLWMHASGSDSNSHIIMYLLLMQRHGQRHPMLQSGAFLPAEPSEHCDARPHQQLLLRAGLRPQARNQQAICSVRQQTVLH